MSAVGAVAVPVARIHLPAGERQPPRGSALRQIHPTEIDPEQRRHHRPLEIIDLVLLIADRTPARRGDMGLVGRRNAERHRDVAHHAQHGRYTHRGIGRLRDDADIERRPRETVARTIRSGQHLQTSDRLPIVVDGQLQIVTRRIGHHPILPALMDPKPAVDVFQNGAVARRIRNGQMQARLRAVGHVGASM